MLPIDPKIDPINQGNDARCAELPEKFFCPITDLVMVDPVITRRGQLADRWTYYQAILKSSKDGGETGECPFTRRKIKLSELSRDTRLSDKIDPYLDPQTISLRNRYYRILYRKEDFDSFPSEVGISSREWDNTPDTVLTLIFEHATEVRDLFKRFQGTWSQFTKIDIQTLSFILESLPLFDTLICARVSYRSLLYTSKDRLLILREHIDLFKDLCTVPHIQYAQLIDTPEIMMEWIYHPDRVLKMVTITREWLEWPQIPKETRLFIIRHVERIATLKNEMPDLNTRFVVQHFDLLQGIIEHYSEISQLSKQAPHFYPQLLTHFTDIQKILKFQGQETDLNKSFKNFISIILEKEIITQRYEAEAKRFSIWYKKYLSNRGSPLTWREKDFDLLQAIRRHVDESVGLSKQPDQRKNEIKEKVIWPLVSSSIQYNVPLIAADFLYKLDRDFDEPYIFDLSEIFIRLAHHFRVVFPGEVPIYFRDIFEEGPTSDLRSNSNYLYRILSPHFSLLDKLKYHLLYCGKNDPQPPHKDKDRVIAATFILEALKHFTLYIEILANQSQKNERCILLHLRDSLCNEHRKLLSDTEELLRKRYRPRIPWNQFDTVYFDRWPSLIDKKIIYNCWARIQGGVQFIAFIANLLLFMVCPIILFVRIVRHLWDSKKHPVIFWLPETELSKRAKVWKKDLEPWRIFYRSYMSNPDAPFNESHAPPLIPTNA